MVGELQRLLSLHWLPLHLRLLGGCMIADPMQGRAGYKCVK